VTTVTTGVAGTARITPEGVYGSIAVAVVCVAWKGERIGQLALAVIGYSVTLWLAHIYARVVQGGWETRNLASVRYWAVHEWPHIQACLPALAMIGLGAVLDLSPERVADLALVATLLNLLVWQLAALRQGPRPGVVTALATVVLDLVVLGVVIGLRLLVK
jgi:hypothetical protein